MPGPYSFWDCGVFSFFLDFLAVFEDSEEYDDEAEGNCAEDENHSNDAELSA